MPNQAPIRTTIPKSSIAQYFSFDVFDTCVTRHCVNPTDLFEALFAKLLLDTKLPPHGLETAAKSLARSRIQAETTARQQSDRDDIALAKIYQTLKPALEGYGISSDHALAEEMEQELAAVSPILSTRLRIQQLRQQGYGIVFISDMYLPGSVVRQMLIEHGFTDGSDGVYVSADVGLSKGSGRLFTHVCQQLGIALKQLHHTGDNLYADVRAAHLLGIQATHFTHSEANRYERGFRSELMGNDWVRSHLIGISRAVRLRHAPGTAAGDRHAAIASDVLAPLLTSYISWVLITAQQAGVQRLRFVDPGLLAIAQVICQHWSQPAIQPHPYRLEIECCELSDKEKASGDRLPIWTIIGTDIGTESSSNRTQPNEGFHFTLLNAVEWAVSPDPLQTHLAYIEAPVGSHKLPEGTLYLFEYHSLLALLFSVTSGRLFPSYRAMVLDYAAAFARSPTLKTHLDMLKRYATRNAIAFLAEPEAADVQALIDLQAAIGTQPNRLMARPIQLWEFPIFCKRLLKGAQTQTSETASGLADGMANSMTDRWIEGSMLLSSRLIRLLLKGARSLYDYLAPKKIKWLR